MGTKPTLAARESRGGQRGAEIGDRTHNRGHSPSLGIVADEASVLAAFDSTRYNGRSDSSSARTWRSIVSSSPLAAGPVSARAAAEGLDIVDRRPDQRKKCREGHVHAGGQPLDLTEHDHQMIGRDGGSRVITSPVVVGHEERSAVECFDEIAGRLVAGNREPSTAQPYARRVCASGNVINACTDARAEVGRRAHRDRTRPRDARPRSRQRVGWRGRRRRWRGRAWR